MLCREQKINKIVERGRANSLFNFAHTPNPIIAPTTTYGDLQLLRAINLTAAPHKNTHQTWCNF